MMISTQEGKRLVSFIKELSSSHYKVDKQYESPFLYESYATAFHKVLADAEICDYI